MYPSALGTEGAQGPQGRGSLRVEVQGDLLPSREQGRRAHTDPSEAYRREEGASEQGPDTRGAIATGHLSTRGVRRSCKTDSIGPHKHTRRALAESTAFACEGGCGAEVGGGDPQGCGEGGCRSQAHRGVGAASRTTRDAAEAHRQPARPECRRQLRHPDAQDGSQQPARAAEPCHCAQCPHSGSPCRAYLAYICSRPPPRRCACCYQWLTNRSCLARTSTTTQLRWRVCDQPVGPPYVCGRAHVQREAQPGVEPARCIRCVQRRRRVAAVPCARPVELVRRSRRGEDQVDAGHQAPGRGRPGWPDPWLEDTRTQLDKPRGGQGDLVPCELDQPDHERDVEVWTHPRERAVPCECHADHPVACHGEYPPMVCQTSCRD